MSIRIKRIYEKPEKSDGIRVLVDRLWPRGVSKEEANLDRWEKEVAPRDELRKWFDHDPSKWEGFKEKYRIELMEKEAKLEDLKELSENNRLTLLFAAKNEKYNNARALKEILKGYSDNRSR
jgi:uncharacterized protein YeaO (DUF488 family)